MIRLSGGVLLLIGSWLLGRSFYTHKRAELRRTELLLYRLCEMESQVTELDTPLPALLRTLESEGTLTASEYVPAKAADFRENWLHFSSALLLGNETKELVGELGLGLSQAQAPAKIFAYTRRGIEKKISELQESCRERKRLSPALGASLGLLLTLLLW